jgi:AraC family transcriptional regulator
MKATINQAYYEARLSRVTAYIHDHLDEELDLNKLADIACLSPYHWHRIYHAVLGETIAATVKRLRLQRAAALLAHSDLPIGQVAKQSAYDNLQFFTRRLRLATRAISPARQSPSVSTATTNKEQHHVQSRD